MPNHSDSVELFTHAIRQVGVTDDELTRFSDRFVMQNSTPHRTHMGAAPPDDYSYYYTTTTSMEQLFLVSRRKLPPHVGTISSRLIQSRRVNSPDNGAFDAESSNRAMQHSTVKFARIIANLWHRVVESRRLKKCRATASGRSRLELHRTTGNLSPTSS